MMKIGQTPLTEDERRENKFALMYQAAISTGEFRLPAFSKKKCNALRSQLNRYRTKSKEQGIAGYQGSWDLVSNTLQEGREGQDGQKLFHVVMEYDKAMWDAIDAVLFEKDGIAQDGIAQAAPTEDIFTGQTESAMSASENAVNQWLGKEDNNDD